MHNDQKKKLGSTIGSLARMSQTQKKKKTEDRGVAKELRKTGMVRVKRLRHVSMKKSKTR